MSSPIVQTSPKPEWRRPSDIMRLHRRKKRCSVGAAVGDKRETSRRDVLRDSCNLTANAGKRRNPFGCSSDLPAAKKQNTDVDGCDLEEDKRLSDCDAESTCNSTDTSEQNTKQMLFDALDAAEMAKESQAERADSPAVVSKPVESVSRVKSLHSESVQHSPRSSSAESTKRVWDSGSCLPLDWSLKQKIRFMSRQPFSWCCSLKSMEQAAGMRHFITQQQTELSGEREIGRQFQQSVMYWMHPNLPWIKLFPRYTGDNNRVSRAALTTTDDEVLTSLRSDWAESFTSAFYLVRSKFCPYFYLCGHQFTVIFLAAGVQGETIQAMVTPTTRGFREALSSEGIEFTLPLLETRKPETDCSQESSKEKMRGVEEDMDSSDHSAASVWLESIGLNKAQFPSLDPNKVKIQRESYKTIDNRPQSLVQVEGSDVQALFNFLLNWRSCVASSGPQTGLPPSIISPVGFQGATLRSIKVKETTAKQQCADGSVKTFGVLELTGPILPHNTSALCQLFTTTQQGEFTATFNTHEATTPFNTACEAKHAKSSNQSDTANTPIARTFQSSCIDSLQNQKDSFGFDVSHQQIVPSGGIKEMEYSDNKFYWTN